MQLLIMPCQGLTVDERCEGRWFEAICTADDDGELKDKGAHVCEQSSRHNARARMYQSSLCTHNVMYNVNLLCLWQKLCMYKCHCISPMSSTVLIIWRCPDSGSAQAGRGFGPERLGQAHMLVMA